MKFLLTIAFTFLVAFFPTYSFAQTEEETTTSTETTTGDETTTTSTDTVDEIIVDDDTVTTTPDDTTTTTDDVVTTTDDANTTLETTAADETAQTETTDDTAKTTTEKTITDYLPYILLGGAGILLISIIAIIFSGREPKEKAAKKEEKEPLPDAPRFEQKTEIQPEITVQPTMPEMNTVPEVTPQAVSTSIEDLVQKPSDQNMQDDLAALNSQPTTPVVEEVAQPNIQEMAPETPTLDTPIADEDQLQDIAAQIPTVEDPLTVETPVTEAPAESFGMETPTLHTPEPVTTEETPVMENLAANTQPMEIPQIDPMLAQLSQSAEEIDAMMENPVVQNTNPIPDTTMPQEFENTEPTVQQVNPMMDTTPQAMENTEPPVQPMNPVVDTTPQVMQTVAPTQDTPLADTPVQNMGVNMTNPVPVADDEMPPAPPIM